ncbi:MAG: sulfurtransferase [Dorea sp.]|jgi:thiosulfate/3-mercaptopyruvate sulfurtransferase|nr:sulfurtransferase [Dorea sp.]
MKRFGKYIGLALLAVSLLAGCGNKGVPKEELVSTDSFEGEYLVTADYVKEHAEDENVLLVDCRGVDKAKKETLKGAIATTWQEIGTCGENYGAAGDEGWGKIPDPSELSEKLGELGMDKDKELILLGETLNGWGDDARVLWELAAAGYTDVRMVDGGYSAAKEAGVPTQKGAAKSEPVEVTIDSIDKTHVMETEELMSNYDAYKVIDVRTEEEYKGAVKYGEAQGGHLPGAVHLPYTNLFREDGSLRSKADVEKMMEDAGISKTDKIVAYCTGGIRSAYMQLVLEMAGYENTWNYDQSYWRWAVVGEVEK